MQCAASHNKQEKINSWVSFSFPQKYGALLGTGAPLEISIGADTFNTFNFQWSYLIIQKNKILFLAEIIILFCLNEVSTLFTNICTQKRNKLS